MMRRIDELHLDYPFAGSRMLKALLRGEGTEVGRLQIATLMKKMGIEGNLPSPEHLQTSARSQNLSLSPAQAGGHPAQPGLGNGHNVCADGAGIRLSLRRRGLV